MHDFLSRFSTILRKFKQQIEFFLILINFLSHDFYNIVRIFKIQKFHF
jgi:hypothetical protein